MTPLRPRVVAALAAVTMLLLGSSQSIEPARAPAAASDVYYTSASTDQVIGESTRAALSRRPTVPCLASPEDAWQVQLVLAEEARPLGRVREAPVQLLVAALEVDHIVAVSASVHAPGQVRHIRYATQRTAHGCTPTIARLRIPDTDWRSRADFDAVTEAAQSAGLNRARTIYLIAAPQTSHLHGEGHVVGLGQRPVTTVDTRARYAVVTSEGLDGHTLTHELLHTLGAVDDDAPHSTRGQGHCFDGPGPPVLRRPWPQGHAEPSVW